jgi:hypothetical protein
MYTIKIEAHLENSLSSVVSTAPTQLVHMERESEEDVPVPFIFVDVNVSQEMTDFVPIKHALILMFYNLVARPNYP